MNNIDVRHPNPTLATSPTEFLDNPVNDVSFEGDRVEGNAQNGAAVGTNVSNPIPLSARILSYIHRLYLD